MEHPLAARLAAEGASRQQVLPGPSCRAQPPGPHCSIRAEGTGGQLLGPGGLAGTHGGKVSVEELGDFIHLQSRGTQLGQPEASAAPKEDDGQTDERRNGCLLPGRSQRAAPGPPQRAGRCCYRRPQRRRCGCSRSCPRAPVPPAYRARQPWPRCPATAAGVRHPQGSVGGHGAVSAATPSPPPPSIPTAPPGPHHTQIDVEERGAEAGPFPHQRHVGSHGFGPAHALQQLPLLHDGSHGAGPLLPQAAPQPQVPLGALLGQRVPPEPPGQQPRAQPRPAALREL